MHTVSEAPQTSSGLGVWKNAMDEFREGRGDTALAIFFLDLRNG